MKIREITALLLCTAVLAFSSCRSAVSGTAEDWNNAFDRRSRVNTWLCADGIYSVSLDGIDSVGSATGATRTFFIFSDSFIGTSLPNGSMIFDGMVNHSAMLMDGNIPDSRNFEFLWGDNGDKKGCDNIFGVDQWMLDMLCDGENLYLFGFSYTDDWKPMGISMYTVPVVDGEPDLDNYTVSHDVSALIHTSDSSLYVFGTAITPNTERSGAADPDGYYYFYGYRDNLLYLVQTKDLLVSRIHEDDFPDFSALEYWDGAGWSDNIEDSCPILEDVSCEMSVTPISYGPNAGRYIAVYTKSVMSPHMMYAMADSSVGPFDEPVEFYTAQEHGAAAEGGDAVLYTYNAKAHPHLSQNNHLLITYNVNTAGGSAENCKDYIPRFLLLDLNSEVPRTVE